MDTERENDKWVLIYIMNKCTPGPIITARVAKRAKVIFSQASVTKSQHLPPPSPWDQVTTSPSPLGPDHNTSPTPRYYTQAGGMHPTGMHSCLLLF